MRVTVLIITCIITNIIFAQEWIEKWEDPNANFYDIQKSFNTYWKGKEIERGKGWKQFRRWEYFMEPRVYPTGKLLEPDIVSREYKKYMRQLDKSKLSKLNANWIPKGPASWNTVSYNPGLGRVNCITVAPNDSNIIYLGAPSGGFWKSVDGGQTWFTTTDSLTVLGVSAIAIHPVNPDIIYIATGDGDGGDTYSIGVLYSTDGGYSWIQTSLNWQVTQSRRINKLLIHPSIHNILIAATSNGVYKTTDSGANWTLTQSGNFKDMEFKPGDPSTIYVCGRDFYKSTNTGDSFIQVTSGLPSFTAVNRMAISVSPANANYIYLVAGSSASSGFYGLYRSTDSGVTFTLKSNSPNILGYSPEGSTSGGQSFYDLAIATSPFNAEEIYVGGINIWKSSNGGSSWNIIAYWYYPEPSIPYVHADIHSLDFYGSVLYSGSDGGIFRSFNNGISWQDLSTGLQITQFYRFGGYPDNPDLVIGGTQDNGTNKYDSGIWTHVLGADGMEAFIDYSNPSTMYASIQYGGLRRSYNSGNLFVDIENNINEPGGWVTPFCQDPIDPNTIYAGFTNVWKSTNQGNYWTKISSINRNLRSLAIAKSDANYIYAGSNIGISRTKDGGSTWTDITPTYAAAHTYIAVSDIDPEKIWVTFSGFFDGIKVYTSDDAGDSWTNISGTLPNIPVNCITHKSNSNNGLYIGTDSGIFYKNDNLSDWQLFNNGLPNVIVRELEIHESSGTIKAGTYGRGLWESPLAAYGATIIHTPYEETEDIIGPYEIKAVITPGSSSLPSDSLKIYYGIDTLFTNDLVMTPTVNQDEYAAYIPSQGSDVEIKYFISVVDSAGLWITSPIGGPTNYYSFYVGPDTIAPEVNHEPLTTINLLELPNQVLAQVTDNIGIDSVWVEFSQNNIPKPSFELTTNDGLNYSGFFPFDTTNIIPGDSIKYQLIAQDSSSNSNQTIIGEIGLIAEKIINYYTQFNRFIPNNDTIGIADTIIISGSENLQVTDIDLTFQSIHTNFGDIRVKLVAPDGSVITLIDKPGYPASPFGNAGNDPDIILDDEALESIEDVTFGDTEQVTGAFYPYPNLLSAFDGKPVNGNWIIQVSDNNLPFIGYFTGWGLKINVDEITSIDPQNETKLPQKFVLYQNHPNPFNPNTTIRFSLPLKTKVSLKLFNILGQQIKTLLNKSMTAGTHKIEFNARNLPSGVYLYRIEAEDPSKGSTKGQAGKVFQQVRKMILLK
jgi:subtilisin-like proprotein convertase family protein/photosystem II stability/assembly factor-like uncharacterized protein